MIKNMSKPENRSFLEELQKERGEDEKTIKRFKWVPYTASLRIKSFYSSSIASSRIKSFYSSSIASSRIKSFYSSSIASPISCCLDCRNNSHYYGQFCGYNCASFFFENENQKTKNEEKKSAKKSIFFYLNSPLKIKNAFIKTF